MPAWHSLSVYENKQIIYTETPVGVIIKIAGKTIHHAGDTCIFGDMKLIGELNKIDIALLPIGGGFTMDIDEAVVAVNFLNPKTVVPMYYNTFPAIRATPEDFQEQVSRITKAKWIVLKPGDSLQP